MSGDEWLVGVAERMKKEFEDGNVPTPERLTARELVGKYGYVLRGSWINSRIQNRLEELKLRSVPDFTVTWQGASISIEMDEETAEASSDTKRPDPTRRVDSLNAAHNSPTCVKRGDELNVATSLMLMHDYSQLPVMDDAHEVKGVISWQSIGARLSLGCECKYVRQCMEPSREMPKVEIPKEAPLFEAINIVAEQGYVLVRDREAGNTISGIVTATDLSNQFALLAEPFLRIGEIEGYLRNLIHRKFTLEELSVAAIGTEIQGSSDLTLGDYKQLLGRPEHWERLNLNIDRREFVKHLNRVREIRNSIMHFNPDGLSNEDMQLLRDVARFFDDLVRMGAM
ncbi:MAG: hypothetical protein F4W95_09490 [Chloroflexi bacterium]|nr:hypothetical protein [Chloroflexota bacterium]MYD48702.1 hypothetical protein [Chloroflexota bacterium]